MKRPMATRTEIESNKKAKIETINEVGVITVNKILDTQLYETFSTKNGPAQMIVTNFYRAKNDTDCCQGQMFDYCIMNIPEIANFCLKCQRLRHVQQQQKVFYFSELKAFMDVMLNLDESTINSQLLRKLYLQCDRIIEIITDNNLLEAKNVNYVPLSLLPQQLGWFRDNNHQETLKGKTIIIKGGKHEGKRAIFKSWSGTITRVYLIDEKNIVALARVRVVQVEQ